MSGRSYRRRRSPIWVVFVVLAVIGVAFVWGGQITSSVEMVVTGTAGALGLSSPEVAAEDLESGPKTIHFQYVLRGKPGSIRFDAYRGVNDYLSKKYPATLDNGHYYWLQFVDESVQDRYLKSLVDNIRAAQTEPDDQVRAAISMVQKIRYNDYSHSTAAKYPYHVLYHQDGDCDETSLLLAYILRELGYGVALLHFEQENHMAVGIKAPDRYCYRDTGYAFIETTTPSIPTDARGEYGDAKVRLTSNPKVFVVAEGDSFEGIWREYTDAVEFDKIRAKGSPLDQYIYGRYQSLAQAYGMEH